MLGAVLATTAACSSVQPVGLNQTKAPVTVTVTTQITAAVTQEPVDSTTSSTAPPTSAAPTP